MRRPVTSASFTLTRWAGLAVVAASAFGVAAGQTSLPARSPFLPAEVAGGPAANSDARYELAGVAVTGANVAICIFDEETKKSHWIPVGSTTDGIKALRYEVARDHATISVGGSVKELYLRKAAVAAAGHPLPVRNFAAYTPAPPAALPAPSAGQPVQTAAQLKHDETEARMLVSDLLDIGIQQRKAYEEAMRRKSSVTPRQPLN